MKPFESPHTREGHVPLSIFKCAREVHDRPVHAHTLALVHCHRPGKTKWNLANSCKRCPVLLNTPIKRLCRDVHSLKCENLWISRACRKPRHRTKCSIYKPSLNTIFGKHDRCTFFEFKDIWRKASLFQIFNKAVLSSRGHVVLLRYARKRRKFSRIDAVHIGIM